MKTVISEFYIEDGKLFATTMEQKESGNDYATVELPKGEFVDALITSCVK